MEVFAHDAESHVFSMLVDGHRATLTYRPAGEGVVDFESTFVPEALRGRRVGTRLVCHALDWARAQGLRVIPSCWFVGTVVGAHPEYQEIMEGYRRGLS